MSQVAMEQSLPQKTVVRLAFLINIISLGGFMMVIPLGPDLVNSIAFDPAHIGYLVGGSMLASGVSSFLLAGFLDRFDRKTVLVYLLLCRAVCLFACGFAHDPFILIALFALTGCFTGPASAVLMASVIDVTPPQHRGKAMAFVGSAFSMAAIIMVPLSLQLAYYVNWQVNFWLFGAMGLSVALLCWFMFPSLTGHLQGAQGQEQKVVSRLMANNKVKIALLAVGMQILAHFLIITNFSAYFQFNLSFPRDEMSWLYLAGGVASFIALQYSGRLFDQGLRHQVHVISAIIVAAILWLTFVDATPITSLYVLFTLMMTVSTVRTSATMGIVTALPKPPERAAFMSINNTVSSFASGGAGILSSFILTTGVNNRLEGMPELTYFSIVLTLLAPLLLWRFVNCNEMFNRAENNAANSAIATKPATDANP